MRYLSRYKIYENVAQARAILRRNKVSDSDVNYKKILDTTNRDGYTGILTKWVFEDGIDLDEVLGLYTDIKNSNLNIADINKLSYEDALESIYPDKREKNYEFIFQYKNYNFYLIKNYQGILEIGSPSWCLKTKTNYDNYTKNGKNPQFVLVRKDKVSNGKVKLLSPSKSTEYGITDYRSVDPTCRYGITLDKSGKSVFNDNNIYTNNDFIDSDILQKLVEWSSENFKSELSVTKFEDYMTSMINDIIDDDNVDTRSFSSMFGQYKDREEPLSYIRDYINNNPPSYWIDVKVGDYWSKFLSEYSSNRNLIGNSPVSNMNGWVDIILYELDRLVSINVKDAHPLYGIMLSECPESESIIKYLYGYQKTFYGREMIKQSFDTIENWYKHMGSHYIQWDIINNDYMYIESISDLRKELYRDEGLRHYLGDLVGLKFSEYRDGKVFIYLNELISCIENMNVVTNEMIITIQTEVIKELRGIFKKDFKVEDNIITFSL